VARVAAPDGSVWTVRRLWRPSFGRDVGRQLSAEDAGAGLLDGTAAADDVAAALLGVLLVALLVIVVAFLPLVFLALELVLVPAFFLYRVLLM